MQRPANATPRSHAWAYAAALAAVLSFVCMDVSIKLLSPRYDAPALAFLRFASGSAFAVVLWLGARLVLAPDQSALPDRRAWRLHLWRGCFLIVSIVSYFHALKSLPLITAVTVSYISPVFVAALSAPLLKERPSPAVWLALLLGFSGVAVSGWAEHTTGSALNTAHSLEGLAAALLSAIAFAGVLLIGRLQAQRDPVWSILLVQNALAFVVSGTLVMGLTLATGEAQSPLSLMAVVKPNDWPLVAATGLFATTGLLCLTYAFARLEANRVAPLEYTGLVWAALLGYWVLGEQPDRWDALAAVLVLSGCALLVSRRPLA